ncbi:hypothetical protein AJ79_10016 [Helicocarpus griseus UAMH5409]|uniref:C6 finger domain transcription factor nscR n=1 Tax=Helicocarpus griseus UAMH5409 TaxID=1447875 RepID=A0A2B7WFL7_9EURO|nr:hypothetical protein AJ79_10016 [Helicocarpus griseus UAMH5409]
MNPLPLKPKACIPCRTRKVKCDRKLPCANCTSWSSECLYPSPIRKCNRPRKKLATDFKKGPVSSSTSEDRLQRLENALLELRELVNSGTLMQPGSNECNQPCTTYPPDAKTLAATEAKAREALILAPSILRTMTGQMPSISAAASMSFTNTSQYDSWVRQTPNNFPFYSFQSPLSSSAVELAFLHPLSRQIDVCWQTYLQNVDQILKVLHAPSSERILQKTKSATETLTNGQCALVFAIYLSSILSMADEDFTGCFNTTKVVALTTYRAAAETALARADFLRAEDTDTLQAFVLFISISQFMYEKKFTWALTGLARRLLPSTDKNLSPFSKEMHKRLWWQLWYLDRRAAEDRGENFSSYEIQIGPELPMNIKDSDIDPDMAEAPHCQRNGWTELSFCLIRLEIARTSQKLDSTLSGSEKENTIKECWSNIRSRYLKFCDDREPLPWLAKHVAHVLNTEMWFKFYGQECLLANASLRAQTIRDKLFPLAIDIIDTPRRIERQPHAKRWKWLLKGYLQFLPLGFLLTQLRYRSSCEVEDHAWKVAEGAFARMTDEDKDSKNGKILRQLMETAKAKREQRLLSPALETPVQTGYQSHQSYGTTAAYENPYNVPNSLIDDVSVSSSDSTRPGFPMESSSAVKYMDCSGSTDYSTAFASSFHDVQLWNRDANQLDPPRYHNSQETLFHNLDLI